MTIEQCYASLGGSYEDFLARAGKKERVEKYALRMLDDTNFSALKAALESGDWAAAFAAAHTLKGNAANLSLVRLQSSVSELTELLRPYSPMAGAAPAAPPDGAKVTELFVAAERDYLAMREAITLFRDNRE